MPIADLVVDEGKLINIGPWNDCGGENPLPKTAVIFKAAEYVITDRGMAVLPTQVDIIEAHKKGALDEVIARVTKLEKDFAAKEAAGGG